MEIEELVEKNRIKAINTLASIDCPLNLIGWNECSCKNVDVCTKDERECWATIINECYYI